VEVVPVDQQLLLETVEAIQFLVQLLLLEVALGELYNFHHLFLEVTLDVLVDLVVEEQDLLLLVELETLLL
jgi:hypothetical protein